jgi:hypothetical protein
MARILLKSISRSAFVRGLALVASMGVASMGVGCSHARPAAPAATADLSNPGEWWVRGSRIIACCCGAPCPCRINKKPTHAHGCHNTTAVHIEEGNVRGVDVTDLTFAFVGKQYARDEASNYYAILIEQDATDAQIEAIQWLFGDAYKAITPEQAQHIFGTDKGVRRVAMSFQGGEGRREWSFQVPGMLDLRTRAIINPGHGSPVVTTGVLDDYGDRFVHADALAHTFKDSQLDVSWNLTGRQANQVDFAMSQRTWRHGGIGWGCWNAHAEADGGQPYLEELGEHK